MMFVSASDSIIPGNDRLEATDCERFEPEMEVLSVEDQLLDRRQCDPSPVVNHRMVKMRS